MSLRSSTLSLPLGLIFSLISSVWGIAQENQGEPSAANQSVQGESAAPGAAASVAPAGTDDELGEDILQMRDPFRRLVEDGQSRVVVLGALESFALEKYKVIGVITGVDRARAIILDPEGKTHIVSEKTKIGLNGGVIREIRGNRLRVREKIVNAIGREEFLDTDLPIITEKAVAGSN